MIKVEVIENFTLERFNELKNIERVRQDTNNKLNVGDKFECTKELADYLLGDNKLKRPFVKVIEIIPEELKVVIDKEKVKNEVVKEEKQIEKSKKKPTKKKSTK